jgi:hypothetical protein
MLTWIVVASGGALGCRARYGVNRLVHQHWPSTGYALSLSAPSRAKYGESETVRHDPLVAWLLQPSSTRGMHLPLAQLRLLRI